MSQSNHDSGRPSRRATVGAALLAALGLSAAAAGQQVGRTAPRGAAPAQGGDGASSATQSPSTSSIPMPRLKAWFSHMDQDGDGWLSLREAKAGLQFDRPRFGAFDLDRDGRIDIDEYRLFVTEEVANGQPIAQPSGPILVLTLPPRREAVQLRMAYDRDLDGSLDSAELAVLLNGYGRTDLDVRATFEALDTNGDQRLDLGELARLATNLDPILREAGRAERLPLERTLEGLFGASIPRGGPSQPPQRPGPIPTFWRLDLDGDGLVELSDLRELQGRMHLTLSTSALIATLDQDGDGMLSPFEFRASIDPRAKARELSSTR